MPRRSQPHVEPQALRESLIDLLSEFSNQPEHTDLRARVIALIPAFHKLRDLGCSLIGDASASARDRVIAYLRRYPLTVIKGDELMVVSGIAEWARRVRELRVQFGWSIFSGVTFRQMAEDELEAKALESALGIAPSQIKPEQYVLMREECDTSAAHRWNVLNEVRRMKGSVQVKILEYLRRNVGQQVTGEELRYLARDRKEWARRVRELRTEQGWPIITRNSGRSDLAVGVYVLEEDRQAYEHDRTIPDPVRIEVLTRDGFRCVRCQWDRSMLRPEDPRRMLELHHVRHHRDRGENSPENLITLCNVHHDAEHRQSKE